MPPVADLPSRVRRSVTVPSAASRRPALGGRIAAVLLAAGLFTISWERFGDIALGGYNVKLPVVLLSVAALLTIPNWWRWLMSLRRAPASVRWIALLAVAAVLLFVVRGLTSQPLTLGVAQIAAVASGAVAPALAVMGVLRSRSDVVWALRWLIAGAVAASLFGLYQLIAFYTGLPQGVVYTGVGTSGVGGRISAFSYEPAYFAYFLVLALGAVLAVAQLERRGVSWLTLGFFALVLVLVNVRALLFVLPVLVVLLAVDWRRNRVVLLKGVVSGVVALGLVTAATLAIGALQRSEQPQVVASAPTAAGTAAPAPRATEDTIAAPPQLPGNVLDPNEPSSNGPRLDLYKAVLTVDLRHPVLGIGPGHLHDALAADHFVASNQGANVVANNVWLQAVADGGVLLLLLEAGVVAGLVVLWWRLRRSAANPIAASLLAVLLVGGMLTSYFFDIKVWVVLAFALVLARITRQDGEPASA